jgi:hypothetical protein
VLGFFPQRYGTFQGNPLLVVQAQTVGDVQEVVNFVRKHGILKTQALKAVSRWTV